VAQFKAANVGRFKRRLPTDFEQLASEVAVGRRHVKRRHHRKMDFGRFCAHYSKDEHGGYSVQQLKDKWLAETIGREPVDTKGVIKGVCGHKRYRFEVSDSSDSEDVSERVTRHTRMTKPKKEMDQDTVRDALAGRASFDADSDELPMELREESLNTPAPSPALAEDKLRSEARDTASVASSPGGKGQACEDLGSGKKSRWRRGQAIAGATTMASKSHAELVTECSDFAEKLRDVSAEVNGVPQDEVCKFSRYVDMQKAATVMVEWLTSAPEDSPSNALKQTLLEGTPERTTMLDFYCGFLGTPTLRHFQEGIADLEHATNADDLTTKFAKLTDARKLIKGGLNAVQRSCQDLHKQIRDALGRQAKAVAATAAVIAAKGSPRKSGQSTAEIPAIFDHTFPDLAHMQIITNDQAIDEITPEKLFEGLDLSVPICFRSAAIHATLQNDHALCQHMAMFQADCVHSSEFHSPSGRAAKVCYDIDRALGFMLKYMPLVARCFSSTQELAQFVQSDKKKEGHLAKLVLNNHCHLWGMAAGKTFVGLDFLGVSTLRWTSCGLRSLILLRIEALYAARAKIGGGITEESSMDQVRDAVAQLHAQGVAALADELRGDILTITAGPGDCVLVPAGWLACERTLGQAAFGLRKLVLTSTSGACQALQRLAARREKPSPALASLMGIINTHGS
jgi:hypothetical protein